MSGTLNHSPTESRSGSPAMSGWYWPPASAGTQIVGERYDASWSSEYVPTLAICHTTMQVRPVRLLVTERLVCH